MQTDAAQPHLIEHRLPHRNRTVGGLTDAAATAVQAHSRTADLIDLTRRADLLVVAVGPGAVSDKGERVKPEVKKGDVVLYGKYSGTEVNVDGNDYLILRESDVLAILG